MLLQSFGYIYLVIFTSIIHTVVAFITVLDQGIIPIERGSVGIQFFIDIENRHHMTTCRVTSRPKMCCLADKEYTDCSLDTILDDHMEVIKPQNRKTLIHLYPTFYHYDQVGYCDFIINFKCSHTRRSRQLAINIPFDTQLVNKKKTEYLKAYSNLKVSDCDALDEDSLRECGPVNCDLKYSGRRPYYEGSRGKCLHSPECKTDITKELPDIVYVPVSNNCRDLDQPISIDDIYAINTGLSVVTESTKPSVYDYKIVLKSNCSTISENVKMLRDMMFGRLCVLNGDTSDYEACCENAILSILAYIAAMCALLLSLVCCLQTTAWCYMKWSTGQLKYTFTNWTSRMNRPAKHRSSHINREVTDGLLKEVFVRDLPLQIRASVVDICQRIDQEIKQKKRYRVMDLGSQVNFREGESHSSESSSVISLPHGDDKAELVK